MSRNKSLVTATLFSLVCFCILLIASRDLGLSWDESIYFEFSDGLRKWGREGFSLKPSEMVPVWHFQRVHDPHPPFLKILPAISASLVSSPFPLNYRIGHLLETSCFLGISFSLLALDFGLISAFFAMGFVLLQPRLFHELLVATLDGTMLAGWLLMALLSWRIANAERGRGVLWLLFFFVHAILTVSKLTGFFVIFPVLFYFFLQKKLRSLVYAGLAIVSSLLFLVLLSPAYWTSPLAGISSYLLYPLMRFRFVNVVTFYLGSVYGESLPWHAFFVYSLSTLPPLLMPLILCSAWARKDPARRSLLFALLPFVAFWIAVGIAPRTPKNDGVRQFVAFFPFLGLLAWMGWEALGKQFRNTPVLWASGFAILLIHAISLIRVHPLEQSYYNFWVGGLQGAERMGLEIVYDFSALNAEALDWLNKEVPLNSVLTIQPSWQPVLATYQRKGLLRPDFRVPDYPDDSAGARIFLHRKGMVPEVAYQSGISVYEKKIENVSIFKVVKKF